MSKGQENQLLAKQIAGSTMESIMSLKETDPNRLGWITVGNVGSNPDVNNIPAGTLVTGQQPVRSDAGPDEVSALPMIREQSFPGSPADHHYRPMRSRPSSPNCPVPGTSAVRVRRCR